MKPEAKAPRRHVVARGQREIDVGDGRPVVEFYDILDCGHRVAAVRIYSHTRACRECAGRETP